MHNHEHGGRWTKSEPIADHDIPAPLRYAITKATAMRAWRKIDAADGNLALARLTDQELDCLMAILDDRIDEAA